MNISTSSDYPLFTAKLCSVASKKKVAYAVLDNSDFLFVEKKDIVLNQLLACERLLPYAVEEGDKTAVLKEIDELRAALDLMN